MIPDCPRTYSPFPLPQPRPIGPVAARIVADLAFRRQVERAHKLGPRVMAELLAELGAAYGIQSGIGATMRRYAALTPEALAVTGGDRFPSLPVHEIKRSAVG